MLSGRSVFQSSGASPASSPMANRFVPVAPSSISQSRVASSSVRAFIITPCKSGLSGKGPRCAVWSCCLRCTSDVLDPGHHGAEPVRALRRKRLVKLEPPKLAANVHLPDLLQRPSRDQHDQDGDQPAHDHRITVALKMQLGPLGRGAYLRHEPDLAGAPLDLCRLRAALLRQSRHFAAKLDHIAITVFPIIEKLEILGDFLETFTGHPGLLVSLAPDLGGLPCEVQCVKGPEHKGPEHQGIARRGQGCILRHVKWGKVHAADFFAASGTGGPDADRLRLHRQSLRQQQARGRGSRATGGSARREGADPERATSRDRADAERFPDYRLWGGAGFRLYFPRAPAAPRGHAGDRRLCRL